MTLKKFLAVLFAVTVVFAMACGGGGETATYDDEDEEEIEEENGDAATATTAAAGTPAATPAAGGGSITGSVTFAGTPANMPVIQMAADPNCHAAHPTPIRAQDVQVGPAGELANVFVYIKNYSGSVRPPAAAHVLDQRGCLYTPHVSGIQVGQTLEIKNSDPTLHNIHALPKVNREFNEAQPVQGMVSKKRFDKPEVMIRFKCDVHPWMNSYMGVLPHPYYGTSNGQGSFTLANVPPGTYTVEAWHEKLGTKTQQVTVTEGQPAAVNFSFGA